MRDRTWQWGSVLPTADGFILRLFLFEWPFSSNAIEWLTEVAAEDALVSAEEIGCPIFIPINETDP
jgi:hypothetical protein